MPLDFAAYASLLQLRSGLVRVGPVTHCIRTHISDRSGPGKHQLELR